MSDINTQTFDTQIIDEFRANAGKVGGMFEGANMLLITTTGAKSGRSVTVPLVYLSDGDRIVLIASDGGGDRHPAWYHNLRANPEVTVEIGIEKFQAMAHDIAGPERDRLYAAMVEVQPGFAEYQEGTTRRIPVVAVYRHATWAFRAAARR